MNKCQLKLCVSDISDNIIEIDERIKQLRGFINKNQKEIRNINNNTSFLEVKRIDDNFNNNLKELECLEEVVENIENGSYSKEIYELENMYREVQHTYLSIQMNMVNDGMKEIQTRISNMRKEMDDSLLGIKEKTNNITSNILFSVIAIVLGISLISAMITGISVLKPDNLLVYFVSIVWIAITVLGIAYLLLREYDKKSKSILIVIILTSIILMLVMFYSFIIY